MKYNRATRRMFLQGTGAAIAIPFLTSLLPKNAWGQTTTTPRRFISVFTDLDYGHNSVWLPGGATNVTNIGQPNRTFAPGGGHHNITWQPLREFAPTNTSSLALLYGTSISPYLESINIMRSLDYADYRGHDSGRLLGGAKLYSQNEAFGANFKAIPTIDHVLNNNRTFNPAGLPLIFGGSNAGVQGNSWSYAVSGNTINALEPSYDMTELYNSIFRGGAFPESGTATPTHPRRDILGRVLEDYKRVMNSRNISSADRTTLSNAMDKFSDVHKSLTIGSNGQCSHKGLTRNVDLQRAAYLATNGKALADMVTAAIMCDSARVFTLGVAGGDNFAAASPVANIDVHDGLSHAPFAIYNGRVSYQHLATIQANFFRNFIAPLLLNLSSATDPTNGRSYLYNSLVYASPAAGQTHSSGSQPAFLAGNANGAVATGNYIDYADRSKGAFAGADFMNGTIGDARFSNNWHGVSYNRLLVTILQAMGLQPADYENNALNSQLYNRSDIGSLNTNLSNIGGYGYATATDIVNRSGYFVDSTREVLPKYDLRQFRNKLPIPG